MDKSDASEKPAESPRKQAGMAVRRRVLGDRHVDQAEAARDPFDDAFQELITEAAWGHVWAREDWDLRQRSVITLALLASGGHWDEFAMHVRATKNTGASTGDLRELILHLAIYTGVPVANKAIKVARAALGEVAANALEARPDGA